MKDELKELDNAFVTYSHSPCQDTYNSFLTILFMCAKDGKTIHVPTEVGKNSQLGYGLVATTDGYYYVVCTNTEELVKCPEKSSAVMKLDRIISIAATDFDVNGICVNPYSDCPCFIPRTYIKTILGV